MFLRARRDYIELFSEDIARDVDLPSGTRIAGLGERIKYLPWVDISIVLSYIHRL
jgi:hypothetical protein